MVATIAKAILLQLQSYNRFILTLNCYNENTGGKSLRMIDWITETDWGIVCAARQILNFT